jgi:hypothetical protein
MIFGVFDFRHGLLRHRYEANKNPEIWIFTHFSVLVELFARFRVLGRLVRSSANAGSVALARVSFTGKANPAARLLVLITISFHISYIAFGAIAQFRESPSEPKNASILGFREGAH